MSLVNPRDENIVVENPQPDFTNFATGVAGKCSDFSLGHCHRDVSERNTWAAAVTILAAPVRDSRQPGRVLRSPGGERDPSGDYLPDGRDACGGSPLRLVTGTRSFHPSDDLPLGVEAA